MAQHSFHLDDFDKIIELVEGAISPCGKHVAIISNHWDVAADEFVKKVHVLALHPGRSHLEKIWSTLQVGIRTVRFSPDGQFLAFFRTSSSTDTDTLHDELVVYCIATGQTKVLCEGSNLAYLVWSPTGNTVFYTGETSSNLVANGVQYIDTIPGRLPWRQVRMQIRRVSFTAMGVNAEISEPVSRDMTEIGHLCVSPAGDMLAFIEERCDNGSKITLYLHRINLQSLCEAPEIMLPNSFISTPMFSPDGQCIAYVGARVKDMKGTPVLLTAYASSTMAQSGYGVNVYDARVHLVNLPDLTIAQLAMDAALCAGIPIGLSPLHQEIFWSDDRHLTYIVTQGNQTAIANQRIDDDTSLHISLLGSGSSRGHSFASDGTCFFFQSEQGRPFIPALLTSEWGMHLFPDAVDHLLDPDLTWHKAEPLHVVLTRGAWIYLPLGANSLSAHGAKIPLIVSIYGGTSPLCMAFDDIHQALTSRGYAVLIINPSGCGGFGSQFADRHINDWGRYVVTEIIDTLYDVFQCYSILDPNAVGIYGGSYGGFLVLLLLTQSQMFKAACSMAGISNITSYWGGSRFGYQYGLTALSDSFPWSDLHIFVQQSPIFRAKEITTPLLLLHGECDAVVPLSESEQIFVALKALERNVLLIVFSDEDHGIRSRPSAKLTSRRYLIAWFDKEIRGITEEWNRLTTSPWK